MSEEIQFSDVMTEAAHVALCDEPYWSEAVELAYAALSVAQLAARLQLLFLREKTRSKDIRPLWPPMMNACIEVIDWEAVASVFWDLRTMEDKA